MKLSDEFSQKKKAQDFFWFWSLGSPATKDLILNFK
jgi:hypothetical protein